MSLPENQHTESMSKTNVEKIGRATARLHKLLKELGHARGLEKSASTMPDARDRLSFIDRAMHEASEKTISAVEAAIPLSMQNEHLCQSISNQLTDIESPSNQQIINHAISQLGEMASHEHQIHHNLMLIIEAQEFRDVAGQVVNKVVNAALEVESILLEILKEYVPDKSDSLISREGQTSGPAVSNLPDSVSGQDEVDDLLASLGM